MTYQSVSPFAAATAALQRSGCRLPCTARLSSPRRAAAHPGGPRAMVADRRPPPAGAARPAAGPGRGRRLRRRPRHRPGLRPAGRHRPRHPGRSSRPRPASRSMPLARPGAGSAAAGRSTGAARSAPGRRPARCAPRRRRPGSAPASARGSISGCGRWMPSPPAGAASGSASSPPPASASPPCWPCWRPAPIAMSSVLALVGERGRELREFIEDDLGPAGLARASWSAPPPTARRCCGGRPPTPPWPSPSISPMPASRCCC